MINGQSTTIPIQALIPATGLFPYYVSEAKQLTKAPVVYHVASLVTILGAILDPICCAYLMDEGHSRQERLFLWTLLIGPPDNKKTYSSDLAIRACKKFIAGRVRGPEGGRAALEQMLFDQPNPIIHIREAASWFAGNRAGYMAEGAAFWTSVYDGYYQPRNKNEKGRIQEAFRVGVTLLAMGPDEEIIRTTRRSDWHSGLVPRLNIVRAGKRKDGKGGFDWPPDVLVRIERWIDRMIDMASRAQYLVLTRQARLLRQKWEDRHNAKMKLASDVHAKIGSRLPWHVLRVAAIYAASRLSPTVEAQDVAAACNLGLLIRRSAMSMKPKD